jgi:hypothetical protein
MRLKHMKKAKRCLTVFLKLNMILNFKNNLANAPRQALL